MYTGKIFKYLQADRPILAIPSSSEVVEYLLKSTKTGKSASTEAEIEAALMGWYTQFKERGNIVCEGIDSEICKYTREVATQKLAKTFTEVLRKGR